MEVVRKTLEEVSVEIFLSKREELKYEEKNKNEFLKYHNTLISNLNLTINFENLYEKKQLFKIAKHLLDNKIKVKRMKIKCKYDLYNWKYLGKSRYEVDGNLARDINSLIFFIKNDIYEAKAIVNQIFLNNFIFQNFNNLTYWFLNSNVDKFTTTELYYLYCITYYNSDTVFNLNSTNTVQNNYGSSLVSDSSCSNLNSEDFQTLQNYISEYFVNVHNYDFNLKKKNNLMLILPEFHLKCKYREIFMNSEYRLNQYQENNLIFFLESLLLCPNKKISSIVFTLKFDTEDLKILKIILLKLVKFTHIVFILKIDKLEVFKELIKNDVIDKIKEYFINSNCVLSFRIFILHDYSIAAEYYHKSFSTLMLLIINSKTSKLRKINRRKNIIFTLMNFLNNSYSKRFFTQILEMENEKKNDEDN